MCARCDVTAEQGCEGRDEFTNGSPRDQWVGGKEVGRGEWVTVHTREGGGGGGSGGLSRASQGKLSAVQPGFSLNLSALCCDVQNKLSDGKVDNWPLLVHYLWRWDDVTGDRAVIAEGVTFKVNNKVNTCPSSLRQLFHSSQATPQWQ